MTIRPGRGRARRALAALAAVPLIVQCAPTISVTVLEPANAAVVQSAVQVGSPVTIKWEILNGTAGFRVDLLLSTDAGASYKPVVRKLFQAANGQQSFDWLPPNRPTAQARIKVEVCESADENALDECRTVAASGAMTANFTIQTNPAAAGATTLRDFDQPGTLPFMHGRDLVDPSDCSSCHSKSSSHVQATLDAIPGVQPLNIQRNWRGSMMAQASLDPLLDACLEIANQDMPESGDLCLRCHTSKAWLNGRSTPTDGSAALPQGLKQFEQDKVGVSCEFCHRLVDPQVANTVPTWPLDHDILVHLGNVGGTLPTVYGNGMYVVDPDRFEVPENGSDPDVSVPAGFDFAGASSELRRGRRRGPFAIPYNAPSAFGSVQNGNHRMLQSTFHRQGPLCGTCHDVSNPALERTGVGAPYLLNAADAPATNFSPGKLMPIERTLSEWQSSSYASTGVGAKALGGNRATVSSCSDCHMRASTGKACSDVDPNRTDMPWHDLTGGNTWIPLVLKGELYAGDDSMKDALDDAVRRARYMLQNSASLKLDETPGGGGDALTVRVYNETGHKLPTGYPEGRRMWLNVQFLDGAGKILKETNRYDFRTALLNPNKNGKKDPESRVYETKLGVDFPSPVPPLPADVTNGDPKGSFHFVLNNKILKDNRVPPRGFTNAAFEAFGGKPVAATYADGQFHDESVYAAPGCAEKARITLYYQTASREYVEFLRDANAKTAQGQGAGLEMYRLWQDYGMSPPEVSGRSTGICLDAVTLDAQLPIVRCSLVTETPGGGLGCGVGEICGLETGSSAYADSLGPFEVTLPQNFPVPNQAPRLCRAVSRKTHGAQGDFDVLVSNGETEPRVGGVTRLVVSFDQDLDPDFGSYSLTQGTATPGVFSIAGKEATIQLVNVADQQCLKLKLTGLQGMNGAAIPDLEIPMLTLLGDTAGGGDGAVADSPDYTDGQELSGLLADPVSFRFDVNVTGNISAADLAQTRGQGGHTASCP